jgi:hypothetical protein
MTQFRDVWKNTCQIQSIKIQPTGRLSCSDESCLGTWCRFMLGLYETARTMQYTLVSAGLKKDIETDRAVETN